MVDLVVEFFVDFVVELIYRVLFIKPLTRFIGRLLFGEAFEKEPKRWKKFVAGMVGFAFVISFFSALIFLATRKPA